MTLSTGSFYGKDDRDDYMTPTRLSSTRYFNPRRGLNFTPTSQLSNPRGLINFGNTCYFNSALQTLFSFNFFMDPLKECYNSFVDEHLQSYRPELLKDEFPVLSRLIDVFDAYKNLSSNLEVKKLMEDFKLKIGEKCDTRFNTTFTTKTQQDASEFFSLLLQVIEEEINSKKASYSLEIPNPIEAQFHYKLGNQEKCSQCNKVTKLDPELTNTFHLQLTTDRALQSAFIKRIVEEESSSICEDCKIPKTLVKSFEKLPKVLVFQTGRFSDGKNSVYKDFGEIYASHSIYLPRKFITDEEFNGEGESNLPHCERFQLASIIVHIGRDLLGGHYMSYNYSFERSAWFKCNDNIVEQIDINTLQEETSKNGFCYYYVHMNSNNRVVWGMMN